MPISEIHYNAIIPKIIVKSKDLNTLTSNLYFSALPAVTGNDANALQWALNLGYNAMNQALKKNSRTINLENIELKNDHIPSYQKHFRSTSFFGNEAACSPAYHDY